MSPICAHKHGMALDGSRAANSLCGCGHGLRGPALAGAKRAGERRRIGELLLGRNDYGCIRIGSRLRPHLPDDHMGTDLWNHQTQSAGSIRAPEMKVHEAGGAARA